MSTFFFLLSCADAHVFIPSPPPSPQVPNPMIAENRYKWVYLHNKIHPSRSPCILFFLAYLFIDISSSQEQGFNKNNLDHAEFDIPAESVCPG